MYIIQAKKIGQTTWRGIKRLDKGFTFCPKISYAESYEKASEADSVISALRAVRPSFHYRVTEIKRRSM